MIVLRNWLMIINDSRMISEILKSHPFLQMRHSAREGLLLDFHDCCFGHGVAQPRLAPLLPLIMATIFSFLINGKYGCKPTCGTPMNPTEWFRDVLGEGSFLILQSCRFVGSMFKFWGRLPSRHVSTSNHHFGIRKGRLDDVLKLTHVNGVAAILIELLKSVTCWVFGQQRATEETTADPKNPQ